MNPHPSHEFARFRILSIEILYCDRCRLYVNTPEIEQQCKGKPDLLEKLRKQEAFEVLSRRLTMPRVYDHTSTINQ
ncbi:MAG: hypothetical protein QXK96_03960 [Candidatus Bathyarchaeia archaeon]